MRGMSPKLCITTRWVACVTGIPDSANVSAPNSAAVRRKEMYLSTRYIPIEAKNIESTSDIFEPVYVSKIVYRIRFGKKNIPIVPSPNTGYPSPSLDSQNGKVCCFRLLVYILRHESAATESIVLKSGVAISVLSG